MNITGSSSHKSIAEPIGVGVVGASSVNPGWAVMAHIPAIRALPGLALRAVGTSRQETAKAAAQAFGVPAFDNAEALLACSDIDLVVVAVKVPYHHALVAAALDAGKMVFSEWPLGIDLAEADDLAVRAAKAGVRTAIGLQARYAPAVIHARRLVEEGYIGKVLGSTLNGSGMAWGDTTDSAHAYMFDASKGATTLTVPMLHALDAAHYVLGEFVDVATASRIRRPMVRIADTNTDVSVTAADHIAVIGALESGAILSAFYRGATTRAGNFRWEINGTEGDLLLTSDNGNVQVADLSLSGGRGADAGVAPIEYTPDIIGNPGTDAVGLGANVLREYAALLRDIRDGTHEVPDFAFAVRRHRLIAAIEQAAVTGRAQRIS